MSSRCTWIPRRECMYQTSEFQDFPSLYDQNDGQINSLFSFINIYLSLFLNKPILKPLYVIKCFVQIFPNIIVTFISSYNMTDFYFSKFLKIYSENILSYIYLNASRIIVAKLKCSDYTLLLNHKSMKFHISKWHKAN